MEVGEELGRVAVEPVVEHDREVGSDGLSGTDSLEQFQYACGVKRRVPARLPHRAERVIGKEFVQKEEAVGELDPVVQAPKFRPQVS